MPLSLPRHHLFGHVLATVPRLEGYHDARWLLMAGRMDEATLFGFDFFSSAETRLRNSFMTL
jgi:hypothetical protein